jgi:hypothetical protein
MTSLMKTSYKLTVFNNAIHFTITRSTMVYQEAGHNYNYTAIDITHTVRSKIETAL